MCNLRPTRQRIEIADAIVAVDRHFTAEALHQQMRAAGHDMSLATVYNTLRQFGRVGLVRELAIEGLRVVYDTDTSGHHHFHLVESDSIMDVPSGSLLLKNLPPVPEGYEVRRVEIIVRLRATGKDGQPH